MPIQRFEQSAKFVKTVLHNGAAYLAGRRPRSDRYVKSLSDLLSVNSVWECWFPPRPGAVATVHAGNADVFALRGPD